MKIDQHFKTYGYAVEFLESIKSKCVDSILLLADLLQLENEASLSKIHSKLLEIFKSDKEQYTGFLKAFANTPLIQSFSGDDSLLNLANSCGISVPSLVTNPILHVVSDDLILNRGKVFTPAHQDVVSTKGSIGQTVVWIPLHDIQPDNYGINVYPKSHLQGILPTSASEFGHTVSEEARPKIEKKYVEMIVGDVCIFSQYLVHETHKTGNFRLAVSFRFNDLKDQDWKKRKFFVAFGRTEDLNEYEDQRQKAPARSENYFKIG